MAVPSFARATRSSIIKASPSGEKSRDVAASDKPQSPRTSLGSPEFEKKLKRPSTLTRRARESIAYNADLHYIKPSNPSKPCPLAALPSELRTTIYLHVFGDLERPIFMDYGRRRRPLSALLLVCRAIRIEAAYQFFSEARFTWIVKNFNFTMIMKWLRNLQPSHKALLSRNRNVTIEIIPRLSKSYTYPPKDFLLDDTLQNHWKACEPFGNLYAVRAMATGTRSNLARADDPEYPENPAQERDNSRTFFVLFCRLASWSRLCTEPSYADIKWKYTFDLLSDTQWRRSLCRSLRDHEEDLCLFLAQLKKLWTRNQCENRIRQPMLGLIDAFLEIFAKMEGSNGVSFGGNSVLETLEAHRDRIEEWDRQSTR